MSTAPPHPTETLANPVRPVKVRRIARETFAGPASIVGQRVETALVHVCSSSLALASAVRALTAVAGFLLWTKENIRRLEADGCKNAARALRHRAMAAGRAVGETVDRKRQDWSAAHAQRRARVQAVIESRKVTHCREWGAW